MKTKEDNQPRDESSIRRTLEILNDLLKPLNGKEFPFVTFQFLSSCRATSSAVDLAKSQVFVGIFTKHRSHGGNRLSYSTASAAGH